MLIAIEIFQNVILIGCFMAVSFYNFNSSTPLFLCKGKGAVVFSTLSWYIRKGGPRDPSLRWDL